MAKSFTKAEWKKVFKTLEGDPAAFGMPERRDQSLVFGSWNIRKFGEIAKHSTQAHALYARFGQVCDLIAVQEIQSDTSSLRLLCASMNEAVPDADFQILCSDVTGRAPGSTGLAERLAFIYNAKRIEHTEIASDISFDRTEIVKKVNTSLLELQKTVIEQSEQAAAGDRFNLLFSQIQNFTGIDKVMPNSFFDFIRAPHVASFKVLGIDGASYDVACVNAHLLYGKAKQREKEFLALLEWVFLRSDHDAPITLLLGDLNLDFGSSNDKRRTAIEEFLRQVNRKRAEKVKVNFPFLYDHPIQGAIRTNSRKRETFDNIAYFHDDRRLPLAADNAEAGINGGPDFFNYGMFDFVKLFADAGVVGDVDDLAYEKFEHDVSDHMPIWIRIPVPHPDQYRFDIKERD